MLHTHIHTHTSLKAEQFYKFVLHCNYNTMHCAPKNFTTNRKINIFCWNSGKSSVFSSRKWYECILDVCYIDISVVGCTVQLHGNEIYVPFKCTQKSTRTYFLISFAEPIFGWTVCCRCACEIWKANSNLKTSFDCSPLKGGRALAFPLYVFAM